LFRTPLLLKHFQDYAYGITGDRLRLYFRDFEKIRADIPPYIEQKKIANLFNFWDNAITLTEKLIAEKQLRRKGLMQKLLTGKRRLPGFDGEWREVCLGDIFDDRTDAGRPDLPLISITAGRGTILRNEINRKDNSNTDKQKYLHIRPGDIGYNTMRMWQGISALSTLEGIVSPAYTIVTPKDGIDGQFMAILFKFPPVIHLFYRYSQGLVSDTWNLKFRHFSEIKLAIPKENEQRAIASVFKTIDQEIKLLQAKADALRKQKKGMMQQLLTGKKRVEM
jgi:type I restriction enzyme S subunit